ncbi:uncharacterized protein PGTG_02044 [Puccinia graminis f. sp. tritici CRL 75-36-700-3]|uniref:Uncharacterized protein n=1 Tax=Puccinia graminis f. sp. tritici (strain CRL 75-36-700-3 / race SCCL) TaxID=418459 RepID=E3JX08_PUCGT|nr:uncharacterized protein PGTG_02044 [Puccinia graminis f. sp. tritici CRL 75-36-700-3]EFP76583.2 hypothetical protein PGTG_02044 [Puccinia graminis f. sp. tritici CRL 75-36-700-3]
MAGTKSLEAEPVSVGDSTHLNTQVLKDPVKPADSGIDSRPSSTSAKPPVKQPNYSEWPLDWKASAAAKKIINNRDKSLNPDMSLPKAVKPTPKSFSLLEPSPRFKAWRKTRQLEKAMAFILERKAHWVSDWAGTIANKHAISTKVPSHYLGLSHKTWDKLISYADLLLKNGVPIQVEKDFIK